MSENKYQEAMHNDPPPPYSEYYDQTKPTNIATTANIPNVHMQSHPPPPPPPTLSSGYQNVNMMHTNYGTSYGSTIIDQPLPGPITQVILIGGCPACRAGVLEDNYSFLGILCAILFFPIGILCCLALKSRKCSNCGAEF